MLSPETQREILDGSTGLEPLTAALRERVRTLAELEERARRARAGAAESGARRDLVAYQLEELRRAAPARGEAEALGRERELLRHADRLHAAASEGEEVLYGGEAAVLDTLTRLGSRLAALAGIDPELGAVAALLDDARPVIEEAALRLRDRAGAIAADPARLADVEERLALLARLARKHACDADVLADRRAALEAELGELERGAADPEALERSVADASAAAWAAADVLSEARRRAATALATRITRGLAELALGGARFAVTLEPLTATATTPASRRRGDRAFAATGAERVVFELAPNRGEPPRPLARVASGGELSRVMLALKSATVGLSDVPTVLFDEVDAGIGGAVADAVGRKLAQLARTRQVICITHLPQIAACADHHFVVRKQPVRGRTRSSAQHLDDEARVEEARPHGRRRARHRRGTPARRRAAPARDGRTGAHAARARMKDRDERERDAPDGAEGSGDGRRNRPAFALILVAAIAAWNAWQAVRAETTREAMPPTLLVAGVVALGIGVAGPRAFRVLAYFVGAALCLAGIAASA